MTDDLSSPLATIERALRRLGRRVLLRSLQEGLPAEAVRSSLGAAGLAGSHELESLYGWRNGTSTAGIAAVGDIHLFPGFYLLSLEDAIANYRAVASDPRWTAGWLPLFANGGGDFYVLDLGSSPVSPVRHFRIEESEHPIEFGSLGALVTTLAAAFDRGIFFVDPGGYLERTTWFLASSLLKSTPTSTGGATRIVRALNESVEDVGHSVKTPLARDALTIFVDGEEVPGLIVYGLAAPGQWRSVTFPSDSWPATRRIEESMLHGEAWQVAMWEVPIIIWPSAEELAGAARVSLKAMIDGGCRVAWIGAEGVPFCDPPQLFDPDCMSGGVLAWMTDVGDFECPLDPDRPLEPVGDDRLQSIRSHAQGLADIPRPTDSRTRRVAHRSR